MSLADRKPAVEQIASPEWLTAGRGDREAVSEVNGGWGVCPAPIGRGEAFTDFGERLMVVPEGDDDVSLAVRYHELGHALLLTSSMIQKQLHRT